MATSSIHPSLSCLLPFYTIPIFPLWNRKIFHLLVSFLFLDVATRPITFLFYSLRNILPEASCCCLATSYFYAALLELCYVCTPTFIATIANMGQL